MKNSTWKSELREEERMGKESIWQHECKTGKETQRCISIAREMNVSEEDLYTYLMKQKYVKTSMVSFISGLASGVFCVPEDQTQSTHQRIHEERMKALLSEEKQVLSRIKLLRKEQKALIENTKKEKK